MKKIAPLVFSLAFLLFTFSSCEKFYTHQFKLQNNTSDTLLIKYIETNSTFRSKFPDTLRRFSLIPYKKLLLKEPRTIYTFTGENATTAPDTYKSNIDIFDKLQIATIKSYYIDSTKKSKLDTVFIQKDFLNRSFWDYFIDKNQDAGVYLFEIDNSDLE